MRKGYFTDMLKHKTHLFEAIYDSNSIENKELFSALKIEDQEADLIAILSQNKQVTKRLTNYLYSANPNFAEQQYWDYADESKRLALLSDKKFRNLCFLFGVALHAKEIAKTIEGKAVRELQVSLSPKIYSYAVMRGQFQLDSVRRYFVKRDLEFSIAQRAKIHGYQSICAITTHWDNPFLLEKLQRLKENLFTSDQLEFTDLDLDSKAINEIYFALKKILIKEIEPKWQAYLD